MRAAPSTGLSLRIQRRFEAPPARVFQAWTAARELEQWFGPPGCRVEKAEVDLRVGGRFRLNMFQESRDAGFRITGSFKEIEPPRRLVFTWTVETPDSKVCNTLITVDFLSRADRTLLKLRQDLLIDEGAREEQKYVMECCLKQLAQFLQ